jgi:hypothetical protein
MINENDYKILSFLIELGAYIVLRNNEEIFINSKEHIDEFFMEKYKDYIITNNFLPNEETNKLFSYDYTKCKKICSSSIDEIKILFDTWEKLILKKNKNTHEYIINTEYIDTKLLITDDIINLLFEKETCNMCDKITEKRYRTIDAIKNMKGHIINNVQMLCNRCNSTKSTDIIFKNEDMLTYVYNNKELIKEMINSSEIKPLERNF